LSADNQIKPLPSGLSTDQTTTERTFNWCSFFITLMT